MPMNSRTCSSFHNATGLPRSTCKCKTNGIAESIIKMDAAYSMGALWKYPKLASCEEKPPVATVAMAWPMASKVSMPSAPKVADATMVSKI